MNDFVGFRLRIVSNLIERYSENDIRLPRSKNVTSMVVGFIYRSGDKPVTQRDLRREFNMSRSSVTGLIDRMEAKGMVERVRSDEDTRVKRIVLTEKCQNNCTAIFNSLKEFERTITLGMSEKEIKQFNRLLDKVIENVSAATGEPARDCDGCENLSSKKVEKEKIKSKRKKKEL